MKRSKTLKAIGIGGLILVLAFGCWVVSGWASGPSETEGPTPYALKRELVIEIELPVGDYVWQEQSEVFLLSTTWIDGHKSQEVIAFSLTDHEERWRTQLSAPPLQALKVNGAFLVATANEEGEGHLVRLSAQDGAIAWDRALGDAVVSVTALEGDVWVCGAQGVDQIDPATGETLTTVAELSATSGARVITAYRHGGRRYLAAAAGRDIYAYEETEAGWQQRWRFRAAKSVLELHPVTWEAGAEPHLLALAHSAVYDITPSGTTHWRVDNNDLNRYAQPLTCGGEKAYAFSNVMNGIYVVNHDGVVRQWDLPGGAFRLGPIPLPIPANPSYGSTVADLTGDGQEEILTRSTDTLFVFDCKGQLLAQHDFGEQGETLVAQVRSTPHYRPLLINERIVVATSGQLNYLSMETNDQEGHNGK
jgi:outer membrane protein assembly factor BamB